MESWRNCVEKSKPDDLTEKQFNKFWLSVYLRYDTCDKDDMKQAGRKCNFEAGMKKDDIWDFSSPILNDLKSFLQMF